MSTATTKLPMRLTRRLSVQGTVPKPTDKSTGKPDIKAHLASLDDRITQEMAKCHQQYDESREALKSHHGKMEKREAEIHAELDRLRPGLEAFLFGEEAKGLTSEVRKRGARYLDLLQELVQVRTGKATAFGATVPPGQQAMGQALGTPVAEGDGNQMEES